VNDRRQTDKTCGHSRQLSLAILQWVGAISTSESWDVEAHRAMYQPVSVLVVSQCKLLSV